MPNKILYIERKYWGYVSIEKVFEQIAKNLSKDKFEYIFKKLDYDNSFLGLVKNLLFYRKQNADIYHITGQVHYMALILPKKNTVLTVHDLRFLHVRKGLRRYILKKLYLDLPVKKLKYITAITETTKNEILQNCECDPQKIRVIENPIQENYLKPKSKIFNKDYPLILQVGTFTNKNIPNVISALKGIKCKFRLIGKLEPEILDALTKCSIDFESAYELDDEAMKNEYQNADLVTFCSIYEGFGLPIIEAQAMQTPVLTSNLNPMKDVCGGAAYMADPYDISDIRKGILKIIEDDAYRENIIYQGIINVRRFEPTNISKMYEKLYQEILNDDL